MISAMTGFDIAVLLLVGAGAANGFFRGFVQEIISLGAWVAAIAAIHFFHTPLTDKVQPFIGTGVGAASVLSFCLLLFLPYVVIKAVARWLGSASRASLLGPIDRVIGFGFGTVKGTLIAVIAFSILVLGYDTVWGIAGRPLWLTQARSYPFINAGSEAMVKMIAERRSLSVQAEHKRLEHK